MSVLLAASALLVFSFVEVTTPPSTTWLDDYGTALQVARLARRPLLVVLENPHEPSERLGGIASDDELAHLLSNFELCRVDVTTNYGRKVAESFRVSTLPYIAITDERCKSVVFRGAGKFGSQIWEKTLSQYSGASSQVAFSGEGAASRKVDYEKAALFSHPSLDAAMAASRKSGRPLLAFVTMPGCYHCDRMKSETYQDPSIQMRIAEDFESVIVDQTDRPDWVHEMGVTLFPTTLVLDADGNVSTRLPGYVSARDLTGRLRMVLASSLSQL